MYGGEEYSDPHACGGEQCGLPTPWQGKGGCDTQCLFDYSAALLKAKGEDDSFQPIFVLQKQGSEVKWPQPPADTSAEGGKMGTVDDQDGALTWHGHGIK